MTELIQQAKNYAFPLIEKYCQNFYFHNLSHTEAVLSRAIYLAEKEKISPEDKEDLQLAAIFHDIWFIKQYAKNEYIGSQIARNWLEKHHHPEERIQKIEHIIMATVVFSKPKNILEEIIQDSDLDNIGVAEAFHNSELLEKELIEIAKVNIVGCAYWQYAYRIYHDFTFNTITARKERTETRLQNMKKVDAKLRTFSECEVPYSSDYIAKII